MVPLVMVLYIDYECFGRVSNPNLNGHLHCPHDLDRSQSNVVTDKIRKYPSDYNNTPPTVISFIPLLYLIYVFYYQYVWETT